MYLYDFEDKKCLHCADGIIKSINHGNESSVSVRDTVCGVEHGVIILILGAFIDFSWLFVCPPHSFHF